MLLYDGGGSDDSGKSMHGFSRSNYSPSPCRESDGSPRLSCARCGVPVKRSSGEPGRQCSPCSAVQGSASAPLSYRYFGAGGFYPCRMSQHWAGGGVTRVDTPASMDEGYTTSRAKELALYSGYTSSPYQPVPGYLDVPVVQTMSGPVEPRHESLLPMESYQPWAVRTSSWNGQIYCTKEQPETGHVWKSSVPETMSHGGADGRSSRRGRRKRVPYTKVQLKELEREYTANKFITRRQTRADIRPDEPVRATGDHLVPESTGKGETGRQN